MNTEHSNPYETDALVDQYMEFHYGECYFGIENYPEKCARLCVEATEGLPRERALDLGCAVGRSSFELARVFHAVTGLDLSARFIACANHLKAHGTLDYSVPVEGDFSLARTADLSELQLGDTASRVEFHRADASNLDDRHKNYDLVFAGNLLDRLSDPESFLRSMQERLNPGGILVISSPYTLLEEFTPRENWLAEYDTSGEYIRAFEGMRKILEPSFELAKPPVDVPFVIRETQRKFQHTVAELSVWRKA